MAIFKFANCKRLPGRVTPEEVDVFCKAETDHSWPIVVFTRHVQMDLVDFMLTVRLSSCSWNFLYLSEKCIFWKNTWKATSIYKKMVNMCSLSTTVHYAMHGEVFSHCAFQTWSIRTLTHRSPSTDESNTPVVLVRCSFFIIFHAQPTPPAMAAALMLARMATCHACHACHVDASSEMVMGDGVDGTTPVSCGVHQRHRRLQGEKTVAESFMVIDPAEDTRSSGWWDYLQCLNQCWPVATSSAVALAASRDSFARAGHFLRCSSQCMCWGIQVAAGIGVALGAGKGGGFTKYHSL